MVRRVQHVGRRRRATGHRGHRDARRPADRAEADPRHPKPGHAVQRPRAGPRRRPQRHPAAAPRHRPRRAVRGGPGPARRAGLRPRRPAQPAGRLRPPRRRPRPGGPLRRAVRLLAPGGGGHRCTDDRHGGTGGRRPLPPVHQRGHQRRARRPLAGLDGQPPLRSWDAPDQQRRRRQQLRDAGVQPAEPRLRLRDAGRPRLPRPPGGGRRDPGDPGRGGAHADRRRPVDLRRQRPADRPRRGDGRPEHRDQ